MASEILRLRMEKRRHEELRSELAAAEGRLARLPAQSVAQLHSYLERHLSDPAARAQLQAALVGLVQCLCAICRIDVAAPEGLLSGTRKLLRDPQSFTSRLCKAAVSGEEAKGLATYLLSDLQYKRVRDKGVNACYEALHAWIAALYFYAIAADEMAPVAQELERQEAVLACLQARPPEPPPGRSASPPRPSSFWPRAAAVGQSSPSAESQQPAPRAERSVSPSHLARALSLGSAWLRAASASPAAAVAGWRRSCNSSPRPAQAGGAQGGASPPREEAPSMATRVASAFMSGIASPRAAAQWQDGNPRSPCQPPVNDDVKRRLSMPPTLLESMVLAPGLRAGGAGTASSKRGPGQRAGREAQGRAPSASGWPGPAAGAG